MSRIDNIAKFAQKRDDDAAEKKRKSLERIEQYKEQIKALKPRIDELLKAGNACRENKISLTGSAFGGHEGYDTHQFISNGWSHLCGFISEYSNENGNRQYMPFTKIGIIGGGYCDFNLKTDGVNIEVEGDIEYVLKRFLENFDSFESEFYRYVDKITT